MRNSTENYHKAITYCKYDYYKYSDILCSNLDYSYLFTSTTYGWGFSTEQQLFKIGS